MRRRVLVAMSGGVDSSVAAALLKKAGDEVIGLTMCFNLPATTSKKPHCCGREAIEDARRVAEKLDIRHYVLNFSKVLEEKVIKNFCQEYLKGHTPNPCIRCNQYLKFGILLKRALALGCDYLATGHYARITRSGKKYFLKKAADKYKDQSYFLYRLSQKQLKHILFPLQELSKDKTRQLAKKFGLPVADKSASQEICFIPDDDYGAFLIKRLGNQIKPGDIVDKEGNVLGRHRGSCFYTIGQREGLGIARGYPLYVSAIDGKRNRLVVGEKKDVFKKEFIAKDVHFILGTINKKIELKAKIRYNHKEAVCVIQRLKRNRLKVKFKKPQAAITPGQSVVFYKGEVVVGGGIIEKVID
ncbi:MAG: tRNA 2-thiouridine(34) synthase MnmA [Candidatus Omnitrophica bacterium]|nr:tRNA 2-thiouridine(34) synthase MnmA [Candidatus Omnitrophota bacterium]